METLDMGRVVTEAKVENYKDLWEAEKGNISADKVRTVTVADALVDTGAMLLSMPATLVRQLGLVKVSTRRMLTSASRKDADVFDIVRLTIQDRSCPVEVLEVPDGVPTLIGQVPLELLDFVVDPARKKLVGNPAHGGQLMYEQY